MSGNAGESYAANMLADLISYSNIKDTFVPPSRYSSRPNRCWVPPVCGNEFLFSHSEDHDSSSEIFLILKESDTKNFQLLLNLQRIFPDDFLVGQLKMRELVCCSGRL